MEKITITREEFRQRITKNPRGFGLVRAIKERPDDFPTSEVKLLIEELTQTIVIGEIEEELFGPEGESHDE